MAAFSGTAGSVLYTTGGTTLVDHISEWSLDFSMSPPEATSFGDTWDNYTPSVRNATGSFTGNNDAALDSGQSTLVAKWQSGEIRALRLHESASKYFDCQQIVITGMSPTLSVKGKGEISFNFQVLGEITYV